MERRNLDDKHASDLRCVNFRFGGDDGDNCSGMELVHVVLGVTTSWIGGATHTLVKKAGLWWCLL